jgi:hypothetical protein
MTRRYKRPALWLVAGIIGLIILVACSPAANDGPNPATTVETVTEDGAAEAAGATKVAQATQEAQAAQEAEADQATQEAEEAEEAQATIVAQATATTESPSEEVPEDGIFTEDNRSERQQIISADWNTDWNRHTVPYSELLALLPVRDGIPALDEPVFISNEEAAEWLAPQEPVIAYENNGDARAYPLQIMTYHEIVNDEVGGDPVTVTFCPLCNSAIVFDRRLNGEVYDFGTSGWLRNSDLVMYDRNSESLWQQFTGEGIVGEQAGEQLTFLPSSIVSFADHSLPANRSPTTLRAESLPGL